MTYQLRGKCVLCGSPAIGRKLCRPHYEKIKRAKRLEDFPVLGVNDVFDTRYKKMANGCWEWQGTRNGYGYGIFLLPGEVQVRAHRLMYERKLGKITAGKVVMHTCDNPACVNPDHLRLGTKLDNNRDRIKKRRGKYNLDRAGCRLSPKQVRDILADTRTQAAIALDYGVHQCHISRIKSGLRRQYV